MNTLKKVIKFLIALCARAVAPLLPGKGEASVAILTMHSVRENPFGVPTILRPELFEALVSELARNYDVVSLPEALEVLGSGAGRSKRQRVAVTFDDGYLDNLTTVLPVLERHAVPATVFVTTGSVQTGILHWDRLDNAIKETEKERVDLSFLGLGEYELISAEDRKASIVRLHGLLKQMDEEQCQADIDRIVEAVGAADRRMMLDEASLKRLASSPYVTIGAHTVTHVILTRVSPEQVHSELSGSRRYLEEVTGKPVDLFAYPNGNHDAGIIDLLQKNGFIAACTTENGVNETGSDLFRLKRIDVTANTLEGPGGRFSPTMLFAAVNMVIPRLKSALGG